MLNILKNPSGHTKTIIGFVICLFLILYSLFAARGIIQNPRITIDSPQNGVRIETPTVLIQGNTNSLSSLTVNGSVVPLHENNTFANVIVLKEGYNIVVFEAEDRFGRKAFETLELMRAKENLTQS